ncbi:MAG: ATP-binding protein [Bacillus sp. (in: Bacteria)]|nr:ATP-binding protein [Bacillus sp. (in: firmicutes)]
MNRKLLSQQNLLIFIVVAGLGAAIASFSQFFGMTPPSVAVVSLLLIAFAGILLFCQKNKTATRNKKYRQLFDQLPVSIMLIKGEKIRYVNDHTVELFESGSKDELVGASVHDFFQISNGSRLPFHDGASPHQDSGSIIGKLQTLSGTEKNVQINFRDSGYLMEGAYSLVVKDITEFKENEKRLRHSEQLSVIGELAAGIAHEIRNPLTSLMGFLQLIEIEEATEKKYKRIMVSELERINLIVNELLLLAKPKEYDFEEKNLVSLLNTVVTIANTQAIMYNIEIDKKFPPHLKDVTIKCEENKLKQVFLNLLRNAIEAMKTEGKIIIQLTKSSDKVFISFIDQGEGIPEEILHNLGQRFYTTKENGTGLGLMISMNIVREHGGDLSIQSELGKGTKIDVSLPFIQEQ